MANQLFFKKHLVVLLPLLSMIVACDNSPAVASTLFMSPDDCLVNEVFDDTYGVCVCTTCSLNVTDTRVTTDRGITPQTDGVLSDTTTGGLINQSDNEGPVTFGGHIITYAVENQALTRPFRAENLSLKLKLFQDDVALHEKLWKKTRLLYPDKYLRLIKWFWIFTGQKHYYVTVWPEEHDAQSWVLGVDIVGANDTGFHLALIHELGHLITMNAEQLDGDLGLLYWKNTSTLRTVYVERQRRCLSIQTFLGCAKENSYADLFWKRFWKDRLDVVDFLRFENNSPTKIGAFYASHPDEFVSEYAVTNIEEDLAESWLTFVIGNGPQGTTIAEKKTLFFYDFPELVALRSMLRGRLAADVP